MGMDGKPKLVDLGNYPVIFASNLALTEQIGNGLASLTYVEERRIGFSVDWVIVARIIRPVATVCVPTFSKMLFPTVSALN